MGGLAPDGVFAPYNRLRGAAVTVCKAFDGSVTVLRDGRELPVRLLAEGEEAVPVEDEKTVRRRVDRAKARSSVRARTTSRRRTIPGGDRSSPKRPGLRPDEGRAPGLGRRERSDRSPRPTPARRRGVADRRPGTAKRGHFNFGEKGTFQLCVDRRRWLGWQSSLARQGGIWGLNDG